MLIFGNNITTFLPSSVPDEIALILIWHKPSLCRGLHGLFYSILVRHQRTTHPSLITDLWNPYFQRLQNNDLFLALDNEYSTSSLYLKKHFQVNWSVHSSVQSFVYWVFIILTIPAIPVHSVPNQSILKKPNCPTWLQI